jgi:UDPglucose 6-dehydrogenase|tara:strand:- start:645 stop:1403 length:759 start_codon:yes stop_codon:yes gene_type:complete
MKIGIIGKGVVGRAFGEYLSRDNDVAYYDKFQEENNFGVLKDTDYIFICTPTPMKEDGSADIDSVKESLDRLDKFQKPKVIIKSTVPVGTTDYLSTEYNRNVTFSPEFLRANYALEDIANSDYMIYGINDSSQKQELIDLFPEKRNIFTTKEEAEMLKYARNVILASQIATANEIRNISERLGVSYKNIGDLILLDERIGTNIQVPGPDGKTGFGGACFPKDMNSLIAQAKEAGYNPKLLKTIWEEYSRKDD